MVTATILPVPSASAASLAAASWAVAIAAVLRARRA
jgi:hypothetical protein